MAMSRKSPRKRVGLVGGSWSTQFKLSEDEWTNIERAYGHTLSEVVRQAIVTVVREHRFEAPFETNSPFNADIEKWLISIERASLNFANAVLSANQAKKSGGFKDITKLPIRRQKLKRDMEQSAASIIEDLLVENVRFADFPALRDLSNASFPWGAIVEFPYAIAAGTRRARKSLLAKANPNPAEGNSWAKLVQELTKICDQSGLPTGASNDQIKSTKISDFVKLVGAIQARLPSRLRRSTHSGGALAKSINEARKVT